LTLRLDRVRGDELLDRETPEADDVASAGSVDTRPRPEEARRQLDGLSRLLGDLLDWSGIPFSQTSIGREANTPRGFVKFGPPQS
jgi:hypothetical protein